MNPDLAKDIATVTEARRWLVRYYLGEKLDGLDRDSLYELREELKCVELRMEQRAKETQNAA